MFGLNFMDLIILSQLEESLKRYEFLESKLVDKEVLSNSSLFLDFCKEHASLKNVVLLFIDYKKICFDLDELLNNKDLEIKSLVVEEISLLTQKKELLEKNILNIINPNKKTDSYKNIFLEIRAATGGNESSIFAEDLFKMYSSYFANNKWKMEIMSFSFGNVGGYKEIIIRVIGSNVYECMKNESGIHRVQRIPKTESRGRVHTSTCSVAVLPELEIIDDIDIELNDLRIDTYRSGGAGGQHVNVTDSAVRIIHKPTGIVAECQDERSQHKNKQKALSLLKTRILLFQQNKQKFEIDDHRRKLIGSGIRSEKIRTYNYIDNRVTDHRHNVTIHKLEDIMSGKLWLLLNLFL
ncbi:MAG TPA: peptide chain release factor 1 [Candidatus Azoamicus sp.]